MNEIIIAKFQERFRNELSAMAKETAPSWLKMDNE